MNKDARNYSLSALAMAVLTWGCAWGLLLWLDGRVDLSSMAMLLALAATLTSLWLPMALSMLGSLLAVLAFNWTFVPPRGSFIVDGQQHALLLLALLGLSCITAVLMGRLRWQAAQAQDRARQAEQLRDFSERLRDAARPHSLASLLRDELQQFLGAPVHLMILKDGLPAQDLVSAVLLLGDEAVDADQSTGLWLCLRNGQAFGPGTGRHEELPAWYLPLRGRMASHGAALLDLTMPDSTSAAKRTHAQSLCDRMGLALERHATEQAALRAHDEAAGQATRNALLAAISHDYRTPLACIMSAASSLQDQAARLSPAQRERLVATILDEAEALSRMTDNSLQLARLDAAGVVLRRDWESVEEIVASVLRRLRQRRAHLAALAELQLRVRLEPGLPLLNCDALLLGQLLENLVDNAFKYGGDIGVEILVRCASEGAAEFVVLAVRDRGPGVDSRSRERIFEIFQRGVDSPELRPDGRERHGAGVGLAACRAIARAHGGEMRLRVRSHGGVSFECWLPKLPAPQADEANGGAQ